MSDSLPGRIFLAHAQEDAAEVTRLYDRLKQAGCQPWLDKKDLMPGQKWRQVIPKVIQASDIFIACLPQRSIAKRGYVQQEFRQALMECARRPPDTIYLIPLRLDDCEIPDLSLTDYGVNLKDIHWLDYFEPDGLDRLIKAIQYALQQKNDEIPSPPAIADSEIAVASPTVSEAVPVDVSPSPTPARHSAVKKILILTANPKNTDRLRLDEEVREIQAGLERARNRDQFEIISKWAVSTDDLRRALLDHEPQIVHFSGHGAGSDGLILENNKGQMQLVSTQALARLFSLFKDNVECVLLNACYSDVQSEAIRQHIDYVIGMSQDIGDRAAIKFAVGFYDGLGAGRSYDDAFQFGLAAIDLEGIPETATPQLKQQNPSTASVVSTSATQPQQKRTETHTFEFEVVTVDAKGKIADRRKRESQYYQEDLGSGVTLDLVLIPAGTFLMGQTEAEKMELIRQVSEETYKSYFARELLQHQVTVPAFLMGKYPVTQSQYQKVMGENPSNFKGDNLPVELVTWHQAGEFCQRLSDQEGKQYRLPSESEWEYACRAGTTTPFHFGETLTTEVANYDGNYTYGSGPKGIYRKNTTDVGSFPPNAFGLYDMHGNVWEWCQDVWHGNYDGAPIDGSAWIEGGNSSYRVLRGGAWFATPWACRSAYRNDNIPVNHDSDIGFRVCCAAPRTL